jgi:steroid 5-alpha reductase family enzyme
MNSLSPAMLLLVGWGALALFMAVLWLIQRATRNAGIVDVAWSYGTGFLVLWLAIGSQAFLPRRLLVAALAAVWGLRLGTYLIRRVLREPEDGRYIALREKWGSRAQILLFGFFQLQAIWAVLFALPVWVAARRPDARLDFFDGLGVLIWLTAVIGESISDRQLARFRGRAENRGKVCREGLWRYSRHPNYFFEWVHWWAYVAIGIRGPLGWLTLLGPALMLYFLMRVTGIPPTERRALQSRGDAYREYQKTTSVFFPLPPRKPEG